MLYLLLSSVFLSLLSFLLQQQISSNPIKLIWRAGRHRQISSNLPPGPRAWPVVGSIFHILKSRSAYRWIHRWMDERDTEIACIRMGNINVIRVSSPEISREILKKQGSIFCSRPVYMSAEVSSNGFRATTLSPKGEHWSKMRKLISCHLVSPSTHEWLHGKRNEEADHLVRYIYNQCKNSSSLDGGLVNMRVVTQHYCGNLMRKLIFSKRFFGKGMEDGGPGEEEVEHLDALFRILKYLYAFGVSDYLPWLRILDIQGHERILRNSVRIASKYQDPEVDERIRMWKDGRRTKHENFLDLLITISDANGKPVLTIDEIKAEIIELMLATVDNPSNNVECVLVEMLNKPEIMEKAMKELDRVVGKERLVQESDLPKLNYIRACIREAFRLHPFTAFNPPHVSTADATVAGYFIPKGRHVLLSRWGLGRNPRIWEEPLTFKPERNIEKDGSPVVLVDHQLLLLSFSTGRRSCPGVLLGDTLTTMLLARVLQGFSWSLPRDAPRIELVESEFTKPLLAVAKPRLIVQPTSEGRGNT